MRFRLLLAYDGTNYKGWQIQEAPGAPPTIQGAVETALFSILGRKTRVFGAGRTDAGVSADGQTAHFDADCAPDLDFRRALNSRLPRDIRVLAAGPAPPDFHARKSALSKTYVYSLWPDAEIIPPDAWRRSWPCGSLSLAKMREAATGLAGTHDFASFQNSGTSRITTVRDVYSLEIEERAGVDFLPPHAPEVVVKATANGFLKQMVRNIVGYLVAVAQDRAYPGELADILAARDRRRLKTPTAPPCGLTLALVAYPAGCAFFNKPPALLAASDDEGAGII